MKQKQSPSIKDEPGVNDFTCSVKSEKGVAGIIEGIDNNVNHTLEDAMTLLFKSLAEIHKLQRKARVVSDG